MLKMLFYINTQNVNQREALDKSAGYLTFIDYYMRLVAPDKGRTLDREEKKLNQALRITPDKNQTNEYKFSSDKALVM